MSAFLTLGITKNKFSIALVSYEENKNKKVKKVKFVIFRADRNEDEHFISSPRVQG